MSGNEDQIAQWNGEVGEKWARHASETEAIVAPFGEAALRAAAPVAGERIVDIGCGAGATSRVLAEHVGLSGLVLGVDVSEPLLRVARNAPAPPQLSYLGADAAHAALPPDLDLLFSRFGVMFFAEPAAAFAHMRKALKPRGRLAFVCWRALKENPWAALPVFAVREAFSIAPTPSDPEAPGPFAFANAARATGILEQAGFTDVRATPFDAALTLGQTVAEAADRVLRIGPASRLVLDTPDADASAAHAAVEQAFAAHADPTGAVRLQGAVWVVTASAR